MKKILFICLVMLLATASGIYAAGKDFPKRDITNVVVWSAGGGTDTCNLIVSAEMAKFLGVNVNVINKTGGVAGSAGMNFAYIPGRITATRCADSPNRDGYRLEFFNRHRILKHIYSYPFALNMQIIPPTAAPSESLTSMLNTSVPATGTSI